MIGTTLTLEQQLTYSRQLNQSTMSEKDLLQIFGLKCLVIGASTNGSEVIKNLVKNRVREIYLCDESKVEDKDVKSIYYFSEKDIGAVKAEASIKCSQNIKTILREQITSETIKQYNINCIVVTQFVDFDFLKNLNNIAIECQIPFIFGCVLGLSFFVFSCFPKEKEENTNENVINHVHFEKYFSKDTTTDQLLDMVSYSELHKNENFAMLCSIFEYLKLHNELPNLSNQKDSEEFYLIFQSMAQTFETKLRFSKETYCKYASQLRLEIAPVAQICGGLISMEVFKTVIKHFIPLNQVIVHEDIQQLQNLNTSDEEINQKDQFFYFKMLLGEKLMSQIANSKVLLVGCGAVGCEQVKNLYSIGACRGENGHLYLVDDDLIEASNIPRQVCFSEKDIKKSKAKTCRNWLLEKDSSINVTAYDILLNQENENIFNYEFFESIDLIIIAVDSTSARDYIANKAIMHNKFLIESGTDGFQSQSQCQIPYLSKKIDLAQPQLISTSSCLPKSALKNQGDSLVYTKSILDSEFFKIRTENGRFLTNQMLLYLKEMYTKIKDSQEFQNALKKCGVEIFNKMFYDDVKEIGDDYNPFRFDEKNDDHNELVDGFYQILHNSLTQQNQIDIQSPTLTQNPSQILPIFDKDNIYHANVAYQISKLRCFAFNITYTLEKYEAVGKIGNIVPAIIQSTSVASGFAFLQILPWIINKEKILDLYQTMVNENQLLRMQSENVNKEGRDLFLSEQRVREFENKFNQLGFYETFGKLSYIESLNRSIIQFKIKYLNSFDLKIQGNASLPELVKSINEILVKNNLPEVYVIEYDKQKIFWKNFETNPFVTKSMKEEIISLQEKNILTIIKIIQNDFSLNYPCNLTIFTSKQTSKNNTTLGNCISVIKVLFQ